MKDQRSRTLTRSMLMAAAMMCCATSSSAFQVLPKVSDVDRKISSLGGNPVLDKLGQWFVGNTIPIMKSPVHESITLTALGCDVARGNEANCVTIEAVNENRIVLYGVRWPDDPPFALNAKRPPRVKGCDVNVTLRSTAQPACWWGLFGDAGSEAKKKASIPAPAFGPGDYMLYRSHYGDLQFMHSMGAYDGEIAGDTVTRMKMWAKYLWGVAIKATPTGKYIRELGMDDLTSYFPGDITTMNIFATGIVEVRKDLDKVAIGALLHMVQDSFSRAHTERGQETGATCGTTTFDKPGQILRFYSYSRQSSKLHDKEDTTGALSLHTIQISPSAVDVSRSFLTLWKQGKSWKEAEVLFDCVFEPKDRSVKAGPGAFTEKVGEPAIDPSRQ